MVGSQFAAKLKKKKSPKSPFDLLPYGFSTSHHIFYESLSDYTYMMQANKILLVLALIGDSSYQMSVGNTIQHRGNSAGSSCSV